MQANFAAQKKAILAKWYQAVLNSYPAQTARFLQEEGDRFANPVGTTIYHGLEGLLEEIFAGGESDTEKTRACLDAIIRIRAVQEFTPSAALAFILQLKQVIREELAAAAREKELAELDHRIDNLVLAAFDVYMQCREQLYDIKLKEIKARSARLLQRAGLSLETEAE